MKLLGRNSKGFTMVSHHFPRFFPIFLYMDEVLRYKVCVRTLEDNFPELVKRIVLT